MTQPPHPQPGPQPSPQPQGRPARPVRIGLGARARQRPHPRTGTAIAAAGAVLLLLGAMVWSIGYVVQGVIQGAYLSGDSAGFSDGYSAGYQGFDSLSEPAGPDTARRFFGFALFAVLAIIGYAVVVVRRRGPLATAGTILAAAGVPLALAFVTIDAQLSADSDVVLPASIVVWLVSYFLVPGARGRSVFLTAAVLGLPVYIAMKIAGDALFGGIVALGFGGGGGGDGVDSGRIAAGAVVLAFGVVSYLAAVLLDRSRRPGVAVAFVIAGFVETVAGPAILARDLGGVGVGILLVLLGTALSTYGGWAGRRFTNWAWAAGLAGGILAILGDAIDDSFVAAGVSAMVIGVVIVVTATAISVVRREPPDLDEAVAG